MMTDKGNGGEEWAPEVREMLDQLFGGDTAAIEEYMAQYPAELEAYRKNASEVDGVEYPAGLSRAEIDERRWEVAEAKRRAAEARD